MKNVIRLTESDLTRIVKRTINEMEDEDFMRGADKNWGSSKDEREDLIKKVFGNNKPKVSKYENKFDKTDSEDYGTMRGRFFDDEEEDEEWNAPSPDDDYDDYEDYEDDKWNAPSPDDDMSAYKTKWRYSDEEDEEWGQTDRGEEELQDLIEEARDFLENECGYELHDINLMSEDDIVEALYDEGNDELAEEIESLLYEEGYFEDDMPSYKTKWSMPKDSEEELGEGFDDPFVRKRFKDYEPENYITIPRDFFTKNPSHRIDPEGTKVSKRHQKPFDDWQDLLGDIGDERGWKHDNDGFEDDEEFDDEEFA